MSDEIDDAASAGGDGDGRRQEQKRQPQHHRPQTQQPQSQQRRPQQQQRRYHQTQRRRASDDPPVADGGGSSSGMPEIEEDGSGWLDLSTNFGNNSGGTGGNGSGHSLDNGASFFGHASGGSSGTGGSGGRSRRKKAAAPPQEPSSFSKKKDGDSPPSTSDRKPRRGGGGARTGDGRGSPGHMSGSTAGHMSGSAAGHTSGGVSGGHFSASLDTSPLDLGAVPTARSKAKRSRGRGSGSGGVSPPPPSSARSTAAAAYGRQQQDGGHRPQQQRLRGGGPRQQRPAKPGANVGGVNPALHSSVGVPSPDEAHPRSLDASWSGGGMDEISPRKRGSGGGAAAGAAIGAAHGHAHAQAHHGAAHAHGGHPQAPAQAHYSLGALPSPALGGRSRKTATAAAAAGSAAGAAAPGHASFPTPKHHQFRKAVVKRTAKPSDVVALRTASAAEFLDGMMSDDEEEEEEQGHDGAGGSGGRSNGNGDGSSRGRMDGEGRGAGDNDDVATDLVAADVDAMMNASAGVLNPSSVRNKRLSDILSESEGELSDEQLLHYSGGNRSHGGSKGGELFFRRVSNDDDHVRGDQDGRAARSDGRRRRGTVPPRTAAAEAASPSSSSQAPQRRQRGRAAPPPPRTSLSSSMHSSSSSVPASARSSFSSTAAVRSSSDYEGPTKLDSASSASTAVVDNRASSARVAAERARKAAAAAKKAKEAAASAKSAAAAMEEAKRRPQSPPGDPERNPSPNSGGSGSAVPGDVSSEAADATSSDRAAAMSQSQSASVSSLAVAAMERVLRGGGGDGEGLTPLSAEVGDGALSSSSSPSSGIGGNGGSGGRALDDDRAGAEEDAGAGARAAGAGTGAEAEEEEEAATGNGPRSSAAVARAALAPAAAVDAAPAAADGDAAATALTPRWSGDPDTIRQLMERLAEVERENANLRKSVVSLSSASSSAAVAAVAATESASATPSNGGNGENGGIGPAKRRVGQRPRRKFSHSPNPSHRRRRASRSPPPILGKVDERAALAEDSMATMAMTATTTATTSGSSAATPSAAVSAAGTADERRRNILLRTKPPPGAADGISTPTSGSQRSLGQRPSLRPIPIVSRATSTDSAAAVCGASWADRQRGGLDGGLVDGRGRRIPTDRALCGDDHGPRSGGGGSGIRDAGGGDDEAAGKGSGGGKGGKRSDDEEGEGREEDDAAVDLGRRDSLDRSATEHAVYEGGTNRKDEEQEGGGDHRGDDVGGEFWNGRALDIPSEVLSLSTIGDGGASVRRRSSAGGGSGRSGGGASPERKTEDNAEAFPSGREPLDRVTTDHAVYGSTRDDPDSDDSDSDSSTNSEEEEEEGPAIALVVDGGGGRGSSSSEAPLRRTTTDGAVYHGTTSRGRDGGREGQGQGEVERVRRKRERHAGKKNSATGGGGTSIDAGGGSQPPAQPQRSTSPERELRFDLPPSQGMKAVLDGPSSSGDDRPDEEAFAAAVATAVPPPPPLFSNAPPSSSSAGQPKRRPTWVKQNEASCTDLSGHAKTASKNGNNGGDGDDGNRKTSQSEWSVAGISGSDHPTAAAAVGGAIFSRNKSIGIGDDWSSSSSSSEGHGNDDVGPGMALTPENSGGWMREWQAAGAVAEARPQSAFAASSSSAHFDGDELAALRASGLGLVDFAVEGESGPMPPYHPSSQQPQSQLSREDEERRRDREAKETEWTEPLAAAPPPRPPPPTALASVQSLGLRRPPAPPPPFFGGPGSDDGGGGSHPAGSAAPAYHAPAQTHAELKERQLSRMMPGLRLSTSAGVFQPPPGTQRRQRRQGQQQRRAMSVFVHPTAGVPIVRRQSSRRHSDEPMGAVEEALSAQNIPLIPPHGSAALPLQPLGGAAAALPPPPQQQQQQSSPLARGGGAPLPPPSPSAKDVTAEEAAAASAVSNAVQVARGALVVATNDVVGPSAAATAAAAVPPEESAPPAPPPSSSAASAAGATQQKEQKRSSAMARLHRQHAFDAQGRRHRDLLPEVAASELAADDGIDSAGMAVAEESSAVINDMAQGGEVAHWGERSLTTQDLERGGADDRPLSAASKAIMNGNLGGGREGPSPEQTGLPSTEFRRYASEAETLLRTAGTAAAPKQHRGSNDLRPLPSVDEAPRSVSAEAAPRDFNRGASEYFAAAAGGPAGHPSLFQRQMAHSHQTRQKIVLGAGVQKKEEDASLSWRGGGGGGAGGGGGGRARLPPAFRKFVLLSVDAETLASEERLGALGHIVDEGPRFLDSFFLDAADGVYTFPPKSSTKGKKEKRDKSLDELTSAALSPFCLPDGLRIRVVPRAVLDGAKRKGWVGKNADRTHTLVFTNAEGESIHGVAMTIREEVTPPAAESGLDPASVLSPLKKLRRRRLAAALLCRWWRRRSLERQYERLRLKAKQEAEDSAGGSNSSRGLSSSFNNSFKLMDGSFIPSSPMVTMKNRVKKTKKVLGMKTASDKKKKSIGQRDHQVIASDSGKNLGSSKTKKKKKGHVPFKKVATAAAIATGLKPTRKAAKKAANTEMDTEEHWPAIWFVESEGGTVEEEEDILSADDYTEEGHAKVSPWAREKGKESYAAMVEADNLGDVCIVEKCYVFVGINAQDSVLLLAALKQLVNAEREDNMLHRASPRNSDSSNLDESVRSSRGAPSEACNERSKRRNAILGRMQAALRLSMRQRRTKPPTSEAEHLFGERHFFEAPLPFLRNSAPIKLPVPLPHVGRQWGFARLLLTIGPDTLMLALQLLLLERPILVLGETLEDVTSCCCALVELLKPFEWASTLMPVLPYSMLDFVHSPVPFLAGISAEGPERLDLVENDERILEAMTEGMSLMNISTRTLLITSESGIAEKLILDPYLQEKLGHLKNRLQSLSEEDSSSLKSFETFTKFGLTRRESLTLWSAGNAIKDKWKSLAGDIALAHNGWRRYSKMSRRHSPGSFNFYPDRFMTALRAQLDFQEAMVTTQLFVGYVDTRRRQNLRSHHTKGGSAGLYIANWVWVKWKTRKRLELARAKRNER